MVDPRKYPWIATPLVALVVLLGIEKNWFERADFLVQDELMRKAAHGNAKIDPRLLFVGIDDQSIADLGRWPWGRMPHAQFLNVLSSDPPGAIAYDIWFPEISDDPQSDEALKLASSNLGSAVFAAVAQKAERQSNDQASQTIYNQHEFGFTFPLEHISGTPGNRHGSSEAIMPYEDLAAFSYVGFVDSEPDVDGVRRRLPLVVRVGEEFYPGLILQALMTYWGLETDQVDIQFGKRVIISRPEGEIRIPIDENGEMLISWRALSQFQNESFSIVLGKLGYALRENQPLPEELANLGEKIIVVGQNSTALADVGPTPLEPDSPLSTTHLNALNTILTGDFITPASGRLCLAIWIVIAMGVGLFLRDRGPIWSALVPLILTGVYLVAVHQVFMEKRVWLPVAWPVGSQILLHFGAGTLHWLKEQQQREEMKSIFSTLVSGSLLDHILEDPDSVQLGGEIKPVAVFFSDIRSFTTLSEGRAPDNLVDLLNRYFGEMVDCVHDHRGTLHKYIGDAIMAVWGDILDDEPEVSASNAVRAALDMREKLDALNAKLRDQGELELKIGMGINFGEVLVGYIGAPERREFTVIGDAVNTASRLEGLTKEFETDFAIGPNCRALIGDAFVTRLLGQIVVKGKSEPLRVYEVLGETGRISEERRQWAGQFDQAMELYLGRDFSKAGELFANCEREKGRDYASSYYQQRCVEFAKNQPPDDWQGNYVMQSK